MTTTSASPSDASLAFPPGFAWGAATSAHQTEGGNVNSDWWELEHTGSSPVAEPSGDACDSLHRWREDLDLVAGLGLTAYRFSLEWSRIEPEEGEFSRAALEHYRRMVDGCRDRGLEVALTIQHFTLPRWLARRGGWLHDAAPQHFSRLCEEILPLCDDVRWVCTINEPNIAAVFANATAAPPVAGLPAPLAGVPEALITAHVLAREVLRGRGPLVGWSVANQSVVADPGSEEVAAAYSWVHEDQYLDVARDDDVVGVQAYTRTLVGDRGPYRAADGVPRTLTDWEFFPDALHGAVQHTWAQTGGTPVLVTENGIATDDDDRRISYTRQALAGLHRCLADGVDVQGYLHWSLLDNFEWFHGYRPTFGLVEVDRATFRRTPKGSAHWLGAVARANALPR